MNPLTVRLMSVCDELRLAHTNLCNLMEVQYLDDPKLLDTLKKTDDLVWAALHTLGLHLLERPTS